MTDIFEAIKIVGSRSKSYFRELVTLENAAGRYAAEDVFAPSSYPPERRSKMDGFACFAGISDFKKPFVIKGDISAAQVYESPLGPNECVRIATGARVPKGADTVIRLEDAYETPDALYLNIFQDSNYIEPAGAVINRGDLIAAKNAKIDHRHIEALATLRVNALYVRGVPRIGILSTGSEVTEKFAAEEAVMNSNYYALSSLLNIYGVPYSSLGVCPDQREELTAAVISGLDNFDAFVSFGGTAYSRYDLMETVIKDLEGEIFIDGLNSSPGKTFRFGIVRNKPFFVFPGNPQAAMVCAELFLSSWLFSEGERRFGPVESRGDFPVKKRAGFYRLASCLTKIENGCLVSRERNGAGDTENAFRSVLAIPENTAEAPAGTVYKTFLIYYM